MNEQRIRFDRQSTDSGVSEQKKGPAKRIIRYGLMAAVFIAVTILIYLIAARQPSLTTTAQKKLFPLLSGLLVGGLAVLGLRSYMDSNGAPKAKPKVWFFPVFSGILTLMIAVLAFMCFGMWPVGEKTGMLVDLRSQYTPMLSQLRDMLLHGGSPLYSFEIGTGTNFVPLFAYYLASPLNLLLILCPQTYITEGILLIILIKMMLAGAFMALCLQYVFDRRSYATVIVSIMYSLMMYMIAYFWDIMWLDAVMFLPLCVMGFERLMRTGKYLLYVLALAYTLYASYYIGFMVCIFMVLYYLAFLGRARRTGIQRAVSFGRFAVGSLFGGGLAMFVLIPVLLSLHSTSAAGGSMPEFGINFEPFDLLGRSLFLTNPTVVVSDLPNIYCGMMAVLALPVFMTTKSISLRRRLSYLGLFSILALSMILKQVDLLWHGLHTPVGIPYRYSFIYCFVLLLITYEVLYRIHDIRPSQLGMTLLGVVAYLVLEGKFGTRGYTLSSLYLSFALIVVYAMIMLVAAKKKLALRCVYLLMVPLVSVEMLFNASITLQAMGNSTSFAEHSAYLDNDVSRAIADSVSFMEGLGETEADGGFFRVELLPRRTKMDTALFDYRGISAFTSTASYNLIRFMGSIGYDINGRHWQQYRNFVPTIDSLMGIRYIALEVDLQSHPLLQQRGIVQNGEFVHYIYENPYALPVGFMAKSDVKDWSYSYYNPILTQNSLFRAMTGNMVDLMECEQITTDDSFATVNDVTAFHIEGEQTATFHAAVSESGQIYIDVNCRAETSVSVSAAGSSWSVSPGMPYVINAGILEAGEEVTVTIKTKGSCTGDVLVARLNEDAFQQDIATLAANGMKVTSMNDNSISGTVHADEAGVFFTSVEYDDGWTVKIDGNKVETFAIGDALLAVDMQPGDHEISMTFMPKGLVAGIMLSAVSLVCLVILIVFLKRRDKQKILSIAE